VVPTNSTTNEGSTLQPAALCSSRRYLSLGAASAQHSPAARPAEVGGSVLEAPMQMRCARLFVALGRLTQVPHPFRRPRMSKVQGGSFDTQ
jgi:hypothetical protein